jgi:dihydrofolate reductase
MYSVTCHISISLDGFVAGPNQSIDDPIGEGGMRLHEWVFRTRSWRDQHGSDDGEHDVDSQVVADAIKDVGAYVMGRKMFGGGDGPWDEAWTGWWGDDPPYHAPVFVVCHREREPITMEGGTTFTFVTDGIDSALAQARAAAGDGDVAIAGGASTVNQYLRAGAIAELRLHVAPITLGDGERLFDGAGEIDLEPLDSHATALVTHARYRIKR